MADIVLTFRGAEYRIPDEKAFQVGELVEEIVTISEMAALLRNPKFHVIARCFGVMLRFAGCKVSDREVHREMMARVKSGEPGAGQMAAIEALMAIGAILMDGAPTEDDGDGEPPEKGAAS